MVTTVMYNSTQHRKEAMQQKPWYQFILELDETDVTLSEVKFPADPQTNATGVKIHKFLLALGLYRQNPIPGISEEILYVFNDSGDDQKTPSAIKQGLLDLHKKLEPRGAELVISGRHRKTPLEVADPPSEPLSDTVSREEFQALKKEFETVKKYSAIAEQELQKLEQELQNLEA